MLLGIILLIIAMFTSRITGFVRHRSNLMLNLRQLSARMYTENEFQDPKDFGAGFITPSFREPLLLEINNAFELDETISFDRESHTYKINKDPVPLSVTESVEYFFEKFIPEVVSRRMVNGPNWPRAEYMMKDRPMTEEEIVAKWESIGMYARNQGTWMHHNIERFFNDLSFSNNLPEMQYFLQFYEDKLKENIEPFRTEWRIACPEYNLAGTVDFVGKKANGNYIIIDWKRSKKLHESLDNKFNKKAKPPLNHLDDCDGIKYSLQLNLYRYILQKYYGIVIDNIVVASFHPSLQKYFYFEAAVMEDEVQALLMSLPEQVRAKQSQL